MCNRGKKKVVFRREREVLHSSMIMGRDQKETGTEWRKEKLTLQLKSGFKFTSMIV